MIILQIAINANGEEVNTRAIVLLGQNHCETEEAMSASIGEFLFNPESRKSIQDIFNAKIASKGAVETDSKEQICGTE